jgi:hypothetical protein
LEDEAFTTKEPEDRSWEEKVPRGSRWIRRRDVATGVSTAAKSQPRMEEVQGKD